MILEKRPTKAVIHLEHLEHNAKELQKKLPAGQELLPVIKANGYGLGSVAVAKALLNVGVKRFAVATMEEGIELRVNDIPGEIFVLNGIVGALREYIQHDLTAVLHQLEEIRQLQAYSKSHQHVFRIGVKFDTGMGRLGILPSQVEHTIELLQQEPKQDLAMIMTHLARADEDIKFTEASYQEFEQIRTRFEESGFSDVKYSICNSASVLDEHFESFDWVRPGLALYGAYPHTRQKEQADLKPVLELKTRIIELKRLRKDSPVGYGGTFVTNRETDLALLPIGYADGYPRLVSNRGAVLVNGCRCPIVGRISMDLMAIDVTDVPQAQLYEEVILIGKSGEGEIRVEDVASWAETIPYEILTGIMPRVYKEYV